MKTKTLLLGLSWFLTQSLSAQVSMSLDSLDPSRQAVYTAALQTYEKEKLKANEDRERINGELNKMRLELEKAKTDGDKIKAFEKNVQLLEENQRLADERSMKIYMRNYFIAVGEVILMEEDIRPVNLLQKAEEFFMAVGKAGDPMQYSQYSDFMNAFKDYMAKSKDSSPILQAVNETLKFAQGFTKDMPIANAAGPLVSTIVSGITSIISNSKDKALRDKGKPALETLAIVGQYSYEVNLIQQEWLAIGDELKTLKELRDKLVDENLDILDIHANDYNRAYRDETVRTKKSDYIQITIKTKVENTIAQMKSEHPDTWKNEFHNQMEAVKSLKLRFGQLTLRILNNIKNYEKILEKFKDTVMKEKIAELRPKLEALRNTFRDDFRPEQYIQGASTMYEVE